MNQRDRLLNTPRAENGARVVYARLPVRDGERVVSAQVEISAEVMMQIDAHPEAYGQILRKAMRDALYPPMT